MSDGDTANTNEDASYRTQSEESIVESSFVSDDASRNTTSSDNIAAEVSYPDEYSDVLQRSLWVCSLSSFLFAFYFG